MGKKKIYRDGGSRIVGGVCSGLSHYLSIDKVILRLIFLFCVLFLGGSIPVYIILWAIMPKARTEEERFEMTGENFDFSSFSNSKTNDDFDSVTQPKKNKVKTGNKNDTEIAKILSVTVLIVSSLGLIYVFGLGFSIPFIDDMSRGMDVFLIGNWREDLRGLLLSEEAFSIEVISTIGKFSLPFVVGMTWSIGQLKRLKVEPSVFNYLGIAWLSCLVVNFFI